MSYPIQFARRCHRGQKRKTGEDYIVHPLAVLAAANRLNLSHSSQITALLHDVYEEGVCTEEQLQEQFGDRICFMVMNISKKPKQYFQSSAERLNEYLQRLRVAANLEPELLILKICDQLDNLKTLSIFPKTKYFEILNEIKERYIPLYQQSFEVIPENLQSVYQSLLKELAHQIEERKNCYLL